MGGWHNRTHGIAAKYRSVAETLIDRPNKKTAPMDVAGRDICIHDDECADTERADRGSRTSRNRDIRPFRRRSSHQEPTDIHRGNDTRQLLSATRAPHRAVEARKSAVPQLPCLLARKIRSRRPSARLALQFLATVRLSSGCTYLSAARRIH